MAEASDIQAIVSLALDGKQRGESFLATGKDLLRKADGMLGYAQAHCEHKFIPAPPAYAHEGGMCEHCQVMQAYAAQHKKQWLALEDVGKAPWTPRPQAKRPAKTRTLVELQQVGRALRRTDQ